MENRTSVFSTSSEQEAIIIKERLVSEGIDALVLDLKDHVSEVVGSYEVQVVNDQADKAKAIVESIGD
jgi:hypothetical protein